MGMHYKELTKANGGHDQNSIISGDFNDFAVLAPVHNPVVVLAERFAMHCETLAKIARLSHCKFTRMPLTVRFKLLRVAKSILDAIGVASGIFKKKIHHGAQLLQELLLFAPKLLQSHTLGSEAFSLR